MTPTPRTVTKIMWGRVLMHNKVITPEQWSACILEHARNNGQTPLEQIFIQLKLLKPKQVEMILPKVQQLAQKHAYEFIPVPKIPSKLAAAAATATATTLVSAGPSHPSHPAARVPTADHDDGAIPLADPAMERLHGAEVGITLPPPGAAPVVKPAQTIMSDDGTIELAVDGDHDALHKANEVAWASDMDDNNEQAPVTVQQIAAQREAQRGGENTELNDDGTIKLAD